MSERTHFVYEAYDADGVLLYIGCTGNPGNRYKAHISGDGDARGWFGSFVVRWRVSGPYPRTTAFAMEKAMIEERQPIWNGHSRVNRFENRRLIHDYLAEHGVMFVRNPYRNRPDLVPAPRHRGRMVRTA